jgi:hypothetical protein
MTVGYSSTGPFTQCSPHHSKSSYRTTIRCPLSTGKLQFPCLDLPNEFSALVALYTPWLYAHSSKPETDRSQRAKVVMQEIAETIHTNLIERQCFLGRSPEDMSPWGLFFAYHICGVYMRLGDSNSTTIVQSLKETLEKIDVRWHAAGIFSRPLPLL